MRFPKLGEGKALKPAPSGGWEPLSVSALLTLAVGRQAGRAKRALRLDRMELVA
jgi:hypothetical protein